MIARLGDYLVQQPKSKVKAGFGHETGKYPFFTCSPVQSKYLDECDYEGPALIFGTGGTASIHYCDKPFSTSTDCIVGYAKGDVNLKALYYYFEGKMHLLQDGFKGAGLQHISKKYLMDIAVELPDPEKQAEIVYRLDRVDTAIDQCRSLLERLQATVKSRFIEMFGDPTDNPYGWEKIPLGERCDIVTGNTPSRADPENYGDFLEWIKSDNINTPSTYLTEAEEYLSEVGFAKCRYVEPGSVLMTCIAGSINCIGNVAVANRRVAFNQQINAIVPDEDEPLYIYWLMMLSKPFIQSTVNMALKGILSKSKLAALAFPFPPIAKQREFVSFVEAIDKSKLAVTACMDKAKELKAALMQEYFG